jgi:hypothetical protein
MSRRQCRNCSNQAEKGSTICWPCRYFLRFLKREARKTRIRKTKRHTQDKAA